jgi:hypothetical protein
MEALARMQRHYAGRVDELFEVGCPDRSAAWLGSQLEGWLPSLATLGIVDAPTERRLAAAATAWTGTCADSRALPIPEASLDHADLHPQNVLLAADGAVFLDWAGGAIGHPFFSACLLLGYLEHLFPDLRGEREVLRDGYLRAWALDCPLPLLIDAYERFRPLTYVKYAVGMTRLLAGRPHGPEAAGVRATIAACIAHALDTTAMPATTGSTTGDLLTCTKS